MILLPEIIKRYRWPRGSYRSSASPIVIGGCGRSGTTLMRVILDTHSHICCGPESHLITQRSMLANRTEFIRKLSVKFDVPVENILEIAGRCSTHAEFIELFFDHYCSMTGKTVWAEKTPRNVLHIEYIFRHFPKAKFIHMIRDARDTVCSLRTHPRYRLVDGQPVKTNINHPISRCVDRWVTSVSAGIAFRKDPRYIEVKYEDLILSLVPTLKHLMTFLELPWEDAILDFHEVRGGSRDSKRFIQNDEATKPMYKSAVGRWRSDHSAEEVAYVKKKTGKLLEKLGYLERDPW